MFNRQKESQCEKWEERADEIREVEAVIQSPPCRPQWGIWILFGVQWEGKLFLSVKQKTNMLYFVFPMTDCYVEDRLQEDNNIGIA